MRQKEQMKRLLDFTKGEIVNSIKDFIADKPFSSRPSKMVFLNDRTEAFTEVSHDGKNAFTRELLSLSTDGEMVYAIPDFEDEVVIDMESEESCPYTLIWILGELENGNFTIN